MIHGPISWYLIRPFFYSSWFSAPYRLHTCLVAAASSTGPGPLTGCYMILVQWLAAGTGGHRKGGSTEGRRKIVPPYHSGPSARHSYWRTLGNCGARPPSRQRRTQEHLAARRDATGLVRKGGGVAPWCGWRHVFSFFHKRMCCRGAHLSPASEKKEHLCVPWHILAQRLTLPKPGIWFRVI